MWEQSTDAQDLARVCQAIGDVIAAVRPGSVAGADAVHGMERARHCQSPGRGEFGVCSPDRRRPHAGSGSRPPRRRPGWGLSGLGRIVAGSSRPARGPRATPSAAVDTVPRAPSACSCASPISSRTGGTSPRPPALLPTYLTSLPSRPWRTFRTNSHRASEGSPDSPNPNPSPRPPRPSTASPRFLDARNLGHDGRPVTGDQAARRATTKRAATFVPSHYEPSSVDGRPYRNRCA
jgi:hypothetical protein